MLELALTRLFSATMYYHFAFMAISLALFGSGASGVFIYLLQGKLAEQRTGQWMAVASMLFAITTVVALYTILSLPLLFNPRGGKTTIGWRRPVTSLPPSSRAFGHWR
jgi:hypothetical protein